MSQSGGEKNFNTTTNHHVYIKNPLKLFKKCSTEKDFGYHHWWHCRPFLAPPVWTWKFFVPSCNMNMGAHRSTFAKTRTFLFIDFKNAELVITNFSSIVSYFGEKKSSILSTIGAQFTTIFKSAQWFRKWSSSPKKLQNPSKSACKCCLLNKTNYVT